MNRTLLIITAVAFLIAFFLTRRERGNRPPRLLDYLWLIGAAALLALFIATDS
ncbi:MAG TPA: hypothetical protein VNT60_03810 [Deinococcales bacterium]|nr:hypothetical protein [Deinococcales bacterium]